MSRYDFDDDDRYVVIENHSAGVGPFLVGLAVGAGIALLFAPRSGEATRRDISVGRYACAARPSRWRPMSPTRFLTRSMTPGDASRRRSTPLARRST